METARPILAINEREDIPNANKFQFGTDQTVEKDKSELHINESRSGSDLALNNDITNLTEKFDKLLQNQEQQSIEMAAFKEEQKKVIEQNEDQKNDIKVLIESIREMKTEL